MATRTRLPPRPGEPREQSLELDDDPLLHPLLPDPEPELQPLLLSEEPLEPSQEQPSWGLSCEDWVHEESSWVLSSDEQEKTPLDSAVAWTRSEDVAVASTPGSSVGSPGSGSSGVTTAPPPPEVTGGEACGQNVDHGSAV